MHYFLYLLKRDIGIFLLWFSKNQFPSPISDKRINRRKIQLNCSITIKFEGVVTWFWPPAGTSKRTPSLTWSYHLPMLLNQLVKASNHPNLQWHQSLMYNFVSLHPYTVKDLRPQTKETSLYFLHLIAIHLVGQVAFQSTGMWRRIAGCPI